MALAADQIRWLDGAEHGLGPWEADDTTDPEILAAIRDDIVLAIGHGHQEDVSWVTTEMLADYIANH